MASSEPARRPPDAARILAVLGVILGWTWAYNIVIKGMGAGAAAFAIVNTLSEDVVLGSVITVVVGLCIVLVFTTTKLYTQIISRAASFRALELLVEEELRGGSARGVARRLLHFHEEPRPPQVYPERATSMLVGMAFLYLVSWVYIILFSEALFFISWSAGVDLPITAKNLQLMPTLALSIPFSARVMAYLRYPYTQDYADFMPGALFVLLLVASLGYLFESDDQKFFLLQVWRDAGFLDTFLRYGLLLAFIPVFSEAVFWLVHLFIDADAAGEGED